MCLAVSHSAFALCICNFFFFLRRGVVAAVVCLYISPFYFSFLILAFLTLFSKTHEKDYIFHVFHPFCIASVSLDTKYRFSSQLFVVDFWTIICDFPDHQVDKNTFSQADNFSWGKHRKLKLLFLYNLNSYLLFNFLL